MEEDLFHHLRLHRRNWCVLRTRFATHFYEFIRSYCFIWLPLREISAGRIKWRSDQVHHHSLRQHFHLVWIHHRIGSNEGKGNVNWSTSMISYNSLDSLFYQRWALQTLQLVKQLNQRQFTNETIEMKVKCWLGCHFNSYSMRSSCVYSYRWTF